MSTKFTVRDASTNAIIGRLGLTPSEAGIVRRVMVAGCGAAAVRDISDALGICLRFDAGCVVRVDC